MPVENTRAQILLDIHSGVRSTEPRWDRVERRLGLQLPGSYKGMIDAFGASTWGEFLHVLSPFDEQLNLFERGEQQLKADRADREELPHLYPLPLYPESGGLLPWAITDNGNTLYFITAASPDKWPTLIKSAREPEFEVSFLPPALLVHHFAVGRFQSGILPSLHEA